MPETILDKMWNLIAERLILTTWLILGKEDGTLHTRGEIIIAVIASVAILGGVSVNPWWFALLVLPCAVMSISLWNVTEHFRFHKADRDRLLRTELLSHEQREQLKAALSTLAFIVRTSYLENNFKIFEEAMTQYMAIAETLDLQRYEIERHIFWGDRVIGVKILKSWRKAKPEEVAKLISQFSELRDLFEAIDSATSTQARETTRDN